MCPFKSARRLVTGAFLAAFAASGVGSAQTLIWSPPDNTTTTVQEYFQAFLPASGIVSKWITPIRVKGYGVDAKEEGIAIEFLDKFARLTGHEIRAAENTEKANVVLVKIPDLAKELLKEGGQTYGPFFRSPIDLGNFATSLKPDRKCVFFASRHDKSSYVYGAFFLYKSGLSIEDFTACVYQEFSQLTGFIRNDGSLIDSVFAGKRVSLSRLDEFAIHNLYVKEIPVGGKTESAK